MTMYPLAPAGEDLLRRARAHSVVEREMPASAARLFALLEEGETWCRFFPVIRRVEWTSPRPFGTGTTRRVTVIGGVRLDEVFWTWEAGRRMGFAVTAASVRGLRGLVESYDLVPLGDARCRLRWEMGIEFAGAPKSVEGSMRGSLAWTQRWCLARLARVARQSGP